MIKNSKKRVLTPDLDVLRDLGMLLEYDRVSRNGPSRPGSDISVGLKAVNSEREQPLQLSLPL